MMQHNEITFRGRPPGQMTVAKRKAMDYILSRQSQGKPIVLGEMMRVCGFSCRSNAKRTWKGLRDMGAV